MTLLLKVYLASAVLLFYGEKWGYCARVEFYKQENYNGFIDEFFLIGEHELDCINVKGRNAVRSVKTDKCIIAYYGEGCHGSPFSSPQATADFLDLSFRFDNDTPVTYHFVDSFHVCSQERGGGPQLDIDLIKSTDAIKSYRGVCNCRNVPSDFVGGKKSDLFIVNYGNSVNIYDEEHCNGKSEYLVAGATLESLSGEFGFDVRSFKPAELKHCYKLAAKIHKFEFTNGTDSSENLPTEDAKLAPDTDIINNGATEITQTYRASSKVHETVEFKVAKSFTTMHSVGVEAGVQMKFEAGIPLISSAEISAQIKTKYEWSGTSGEETANTTTLSLEKSVEIEQQLRIPSCKKCTMSSYVKMVKGFPIKYKAYAKVSAPEDLSPLASKEIRENLPAGMDYVRDIGQYTVEGVTEGTMIADYGMKTMIEVNCEAKPIPNCVPSAYAPAADDHQIYEFPHHVGNKRGTLTSSRGSNFLSFLKSSIGLFVKYFK